MIKIEFKEGFLEFSSNYCYSTASAAIKAAAKNLNKQVAAKKQWTVCDFNGPSWSHSSHEETHVCLAKIAGDFSEDRIRHLFEHGWWNDSAQIKFSTRNCYGGNASITIED